MTRACLSSKEDFIMKKSLGAKTIVFPTPTFIVGTYDKEGKPNVMNAAWGGICASSPPCVAVSLRKNRYTYENIMDRKAFTISIPSKTYAKEADYFGMVSGRETDKFSATGLTPVKGTLVDAPYVKEFPINLECKVIQTVDIGSHTQIIGEIVDIKVDEAMLGEKGLPDIEKMELIMFDPANSRYHVAGEDVGKAFQIGNEV